MPWIKHISLESVVKGNHPVDSNMILIQIIDKGSSFPKPYFKDQFDEIYKFDFQDVSVEGFGGISDQQASDLSKILLESKKNEKHIIVHCHAGICRSGAVAEIAEILGYKVLNNINERIPNVLVKTKLLKALGLSYE